MSSTRNTEALANMNNGGSGEFRARIERDEPLTTHGHKPGVLVGNDAAPEFHAKTLPAGSAPASRTFKPDTDNEVPPDGTDADAAQPNAADTIIGATSADVHTGLGHPGAGQSSAEIHHDGQSHRKNPGQSLEGTGATAGQSGINAHDPAFADQRALNKDNAKVDGRDAGGAPAQDRLPESAETVAAERA